MFFSGMISVGHIRSNWNYISGNSCTIKAILAKMWARSFLQCCKYPVLVCSIMEEVDIVDSPCVTTLPIQVGVFKLTHKSGKPQVSNGFPAQIMIANTIIIMLIEVISNVRYEVWSVIGRFKIISGGAFFTSIFPRQFYFKSLIIWRRQNKRPRPKVYWETLLSFHPIVVSKCKHSICHADYILFR